MFKFLYDKYDLPFQKIASIIWNWKMDILKYMITKQSNRGDDLKEVLDAAIIADRLDLVKFLVDEKNTDWISAIPSEDYSRSNPTPLISALRIGRIEMVKYFMDKGMLLQGGAFLKDIDLTEMLHPDLPFELFLLSIAQGARCNDPELLNKACAFGNLRVVKYLREEPNNWDLNHLGEHGKTPLIEAIEHAELVFYLLETGEVDVNKQFLSAYSGQHSSPLSLACRDGNSEIIKSLANHKDIKINFQSNQGETALMELISGRGDVKTKIELTKMFAKLGADLNRANKNGNTALMMACQYKNMTKLVRCLLKFGADPNLKNVDSETAFTVAFKMECAMNMKILLKNGAKVEGKFRTNFSKAKRRYISSPLKDVELPPPRDYFHMG